MKLFEAITAESLVLFGSDSPQDFRNMVCAWLDANPASVLIERDNRLHPAPAFPFTVWRRVFKETRGSMHATMQEAFIAGGKS